MFNLDSIVRKNIKDLKPYSSARDEYSGEAQVWIDANENPFDTGVNRYPDPHQHDLKKMVGTVKGVSPSCLFIGNGSDEIIDLLFRMVCQPGKSNAIVLPPTYGMYAVAAQINDVEVRQVFLTSSFEVDVSAVLRAIDANTRLIFICSPNNPTGTLVQSSTIEQIATSFGGIVVVDEAYVDFVQQGGGAVELLARNPNIYVLQTLSKAWGLAGARIGIGVASPEIQRYMTKIKAPYNISSLNQQVAINSLEDMEGFKMKVELIMEERERLQKALSSFSCVVTVYPSDANFLLVKFKKVEEVFMHLKQNGIVARDRSGEKWCDGCIRITVGTPDENTYLLEVLNMYKEL